jgi:RNA polymerase sigma-70 factor, ECF subfamily
MDEHEAIAGLKRGQIEGLAPLVERYQQQAIYAATLITRDRPLAEDIVQTAFLRAYERIAQFDARRPFRPWFLQMVVNDAVKAAQRRSSLSLDAPADAGATLYQALRDPAPSPEQLFEHGETRQAVSQALERLSPAQRAVVVQHYYLDMSMEEIAQNLDCPPGTVKSRLHSARDRLRSLLRPFASSQS